tara:strand:- start:12076 stop:13737 length:1662 start_codon:yes stop_codon:yes gene_type:complete
MDSKDIVDYKDIVVQQPTHISIDGDISRNIISEFSSNPTAIFSPIFATLISIVVGYTLIPDDTWSKIETLEAEAKLNSKTLSFFETVESANVPNIPMITAAAGGHVPWRVLGKGLKKIHKDRSKTKGGNPQNDSDILKHVAMMHNKAIREDGPSYAIKKISKPINFGALEKGTRIIFWTVNRIHTTIEIVQDNNFYSLGYFPVRNFTNACARLLLPICQGGWVSPDPSFNSVLSQMADKHISQIPDEPSGLLEFMGCYEVKDKNHSDLNEINRVINQLQNRQTIVDDNSYIYKKWLMIYDQSKRNEGLTQYRTVSQPDGFFAMLGAGIVGKSCCSKTMTLFPKHLINPSTVPSHLSLKTSLEQDDCFKHITNEDLFQDENYVSTVPFTEQLPAGWTVEVKPSDTGKNVIMYVNTRTNERTETKPQLPESTVLTKLKTQVMDIQLKTSSKFKELMKYMYVDVLLTVGALVLMEYTKYQTIKMLFFSSNSLTGLVINGGKHTKKLKGIIKSKRTRTNLKKTKTRRLHRRKQISAFGKSKANINRIRLNKMEAPYF